MAVTDHPCTKRVLNMSIGDWFKAAGLLVTVSMPLSAWLIGHEVRLTKIESSRFTKEHGERITEKVTHLQLNMETRLQRLELLLERIEKQTK